MIKIPTTKNLIRRVFNGTVWEEKENYKNCQRMVQLAWRFSLLSVKERKISAIGMLGDMHLPRETIYQ
jgi:hypothetical protein